jgi:phage tail sheath protein FI
LSPGDLGNVFVRILKALGRTLHSVRPQGHEYLDLIKDQIDASLQWVATEPYSEALYSKVLSTVEVELTLFWRMGKLKGDAPEQAFFARCDDSTMTEEDIAAHRVVCLIGVAPVKPGQFILFDIVQTAS